jgi:hypothetical protein
MRGPRINQVISWEDGKGKAKGTAAGYYVIPPFSHQNFVTQGTYQLLLLAL